MARSKSKGSLPQFVPLLHRTMDSPAWLALSVYSRALYPAMKRRTGAHGAKNGDFSFSVREAAEYLRCDKNTASKALDELQAKGFAVPKQIGRLGSCGQGNATTWRLTELGTADNHSPSADFLRWADGGDFPIQKAPRPTRKPDPKKQNPV